MPAAGRVMQVERACLDLISAGVPGDRLPGEAELAARFRTSRVTVREALSRLWYAGLVVRRWGVGTFIARAQPDRTAGSTYLALDQVGSLPQRLRDDGHALALTHFRTASADWPAWTADDHVAGTCWRVERCMAVDDVPAILLYDHVPTHAEGVPLTRPELLGDLGRDLPSLLRSQGLRIVKDEATLDAVNATAAVAGHLGLPRGRAVLHARQRSLSDSGQVVACTDAYYRTDVFATRLIRTVAD